MIAVLSTEPDSPAAPANESAITGGGNDLHLGNTGGQ
jgi:hypothetical protein